MNLKNPKTLAALIWTGVALIIVLLVGGMILLSVQLTGWQNTIESKTLNLKNGANGQNGAQGVQGLAGNDGNQGEKGDKGDTGAQGAQGPQGVPGQDGYTIVGPQGAQGDKGDQGDRGADGREIEFCYQDDGTLGQRYVGSMFCDDIPAPTPSPEATP